MNNALLYIGGLLILVLSALVAVPYFVDWNRYRGVFEEEATRVLGRDVRVGGAVNLRLLPSPYVSFEKLKIADAGGTGRESVFRADSFTMWLSIPPLLKGVVEAHKVELKRPMLRLVSDAEGGGNWQSLSVSAGELPFVPKDVALQSVTLIDGIISLGGPTQLDLATIDNIDGELSAETLTGPYKFVGTLSWNGNPRDVRLSTAAQDQNGDIRFKTSVRAIDTGNTYVLAGTIADLKGKPTLEGDLTAMLRAGPAAAPATAANGDASGAAAPSPVAPPAQAPDARAGAADTASDHPPLLPAGAAAAGGATFEMRSKVKGDVNGVVLDDLTLSLEHDGPPQLISGSAKMSWPDRLKTELTLSSRWIDLDKVVGRDGKAVPLPAARDLFEALGRTLPETADTEARITFDQVTLGGEGLSGLEVTIAKSGGPLEIRGIRAGLPGGARFDLDGVLTGPSADRTFDGFVSLSGPSLSRLLSWGFQQAAVLPGRAEGTFALDGRLKLNARHVEIGDAAAEIAGLPVKGGISLGIGERKTAALTLEGSRIDIGNLWPGALAPDRIAGLMRAPSEAPAQASAPAPAKTEKGGAQTDGPSAPSSLPLASMDLRLKLHAGELIDGERVLTGVDADVALEGGRLALPVLRFTTAEGISVDLEGETADVSGNLNGTVRGTIAAPTGEALAGLGAFVGLDGPDGADLTRFRDLAPLRLAGTLEAGKRLAGSTDVSFDGSSNGGRLTGRVLLDGGWSSWRRGPADIELFLEQPRAARIAEAMLGMTPVSEPLPASEKARLTVKAAGAAGKDILLSAELASPTQSVAYEGRASLPETGGTSVAGTLVAKNSDTRTLLSLAGAPVPVGIESRVKGTVAIEASTERTVLFPRDLVIGGSKMSGRIVIAPAKDGARRHFEADLDVDQASVPGLMTVMLEPSDKAPVVPPPPEPATREAKGKRREVAPQATPAAEPAASVWPLQSFDPGMLRDVEGRVTARFGALALEPGLAMSDAVLKVGLSPGKLTVESLEAKGVGGRIASRLTLEKTPAGAALDGNLEIKVPAAAGPADAASFHLAFSGRAVSPSGLMSVLKGDGELKLADATLSGNTPKAVAEVSEGALAGRGASGGDDLANALKTALKGGTLPLGSLTLPVRLADGLMTLDQLSVDTPDGRASLQAMVELGTLRFDSEWQIEPRVTRELPFSAATPTDADAASPADVGAGTAQAPAPATTERVILPALTVTYAGKLRDFSSLEPIVATASLERELSVRKMERDVDQLERLRRQDEARAKADLERQKALEAERTRQLENLSAPWPMPEVPVAPEGSPTDASIPPGGSAASGATTAEAQTAGTPGAPPAGVPGADERPLAPQRPRPVKKRPANEWQPFQLQPF